MRVFPEFRVRSYPYFTSTLPSSETSLSRRGLKELISGTNVGQDWDDAHTDLTGFHTA
jgi:hypothetical protein